MHFVYTYANIIKFKIFHVLGPSYLRHDKVSLFNINARRHSILSMIEQEIDCKVVVKLDSKILIKR